MTPVGSVSAHRTSTAAIPGEGSRVGRNIAALAGSQIVTWTLSLGWNVFVPRALGPHGMGELTIATAVAGVLSVFASLGIGTLMVREIARDHARAPQLVGTALLTRALIVPPVLGAVGVYVLLGHWSTEQVVVLWLATTAMLLTFFIQPFQSAFQGIERMQYLAYSDIISKTVLSVVGIALVIIGFRVVGIMWLTVLTTVLALLLCAWWSRGKFSVDLTFDLRSIGVLVLAALPFWSMGLAHTVYTWIDSLMLSVMAPDVVVGWYAVPTKIFNTIGFSAILISTAMLPRFSAAVREGADALRSAVKPALELVLVLSLPITVGTALLAHQFIDAIYGRQFEPSIGVLQIMVFMLPAVSFSVLANQVLIANNRQLAWTKVTIAAAIINPLLNLILIPLFQSRTGNGAIGAAISLLATEVGMAVAGLYLLPPILDASSVSRLLRAVAATGGMALAVWMSTGMGALVAVAVGGIVFATLAIAFKLFTVEERAILRRITLRLFWNDSGRYSTTKYRGWDDISARPIGKFGR